MKAICSLKKIHKCVLISNGSEKWHNCIDYNIYEEFTSSLALIQNSHCNLEKTNLVSRNAVSVCGKKVSRNLKSNQLTRSRRLNQRKPTG